MNLCRAVWLVICCLLYPGPAAAVLPLRDQWRAACRALASGEAARALGLLQEFHEWYGGEAVVREPGFREGWIRLWGLAALQAGELNQAAGLLERWFEENPEQPRYRAFLRFQLAALQRSLGEPARAEVHRQAFLRDHPELPECALIHWARADEALARRDFAAARAGLEAARAVPALRPTGVALANAALALVELTDGAPARAFELLNDSRATPSSPVADFWRALIAPALVDELLAHEQPQDAAVAAGWFDDPQRMRPQLQALVAGFTRRARDAAATGARHAVWRAHWREQLARLEHSLKQQADAAADNPLYPLRLRALLEAQAPRRAAILSQALLRSPARISDTLRATAYRCLIEARLALRDWPAAEAATLEFQQRHPDDPALPDILFMGARVAAARGDWAAAVRQVDHLLQLPGEQPGATGWRMLRADWLLQSGAAEAALEAFTQLGGETPATWDAFVTFQKARCHQALREDPQALTLFEEVPGRNGATPALREAALTEQLKLYLRRFEPSAFTAALKAYRDAFPEGRNRWTVENLAGTFAQQQGRRAEAVALFEAVAAGAHTEATFARRRLAEIHRRGNDLAALLDNATGWIRAALDGRVPHAPEAAADCRHFQQETGEAALSADLAGRLLDGIHAGDPRLPALDYLDVFQHGWAHYRSLAHTGAPFMEWLEDASARALQEQRWRAYAACQLHAAREFDRVRRGDSADTRRIHVLRVVDPQLLDSGALLAVAATAQRYDFPEAAMLLESFLQRFPESAQRPRALLLLARIRDREGAPAAVRALLGEIVRAWPDAAAYPEAALALAAGHLAHSQPEPALPVLDALLARPGLAPATAADALLLRVRADFMLGETERGILSGLRLLTLYPDFHDTAREAAELLRERCAAVADPDRRLALSRRLQQLAADHTPDAIPGSDDA
jgi:tetratricopeptide (TPR) repeat protein